MIVSIIIGIILIVINLVILLVFLYYGYDLFHRIFRHGIETVIPSYLRMMSR